MTPEEAAAQYGELLRVIGESIQSAEIGSLTYLRGAMAKRIHNDGQLSTGSKIGTYKGTYYKKKRERKGLQTAYVDLTFNRDLLRSYRVGLVSNTKNNALGFVSDLQRKKGEKHEDYYGVIFHPTNSDNREMANQYARILDQSIRRKLAALGYDTR